MEENQKMKSGSQKLKKVLAFVMTAVMVLTAVTFGGLTFSASAEDGELTDGYYTYTVENGEATITGCDTSINGEVVIPDTLGGYPVTRINDSAFYGCRGLTSITIPDSVTSIGDWAFNGCAGLTSLTIPDGVTIIEQQAFNGCTGLTSITIGNSVTSIGNDVFRGCTSLTSITIPDSVTIIGNGAFYGCTGLTSVTIGNSVTSIGGWAFVNTAYYNGASNWEDDVLYIGNHLIEAKDSIFGAYDIKDGTKTIAGNAFSHCTGLTSITIPDSMTSIGNDAFYGCTGLTSITIPDSVTSIGSGVFYNTAYYNDDSNWEDDVLYIGNHLIEAKDSIFGAYDIKDGTKTIAGNAFSHCTGLTSITIPDSVTSIVDDAFYDCTGLTSITIGNSVTSIGEWAFYGCTGLKSITIPDSVTSIGGGAFYDCTGLTSITIGNSVTSIGEWAFYGCTGLKSITIPDSVTSIGGGAFKDCTGLTSVTIGNSVTSIGEEAFYGCTGLTSITIPDSVTSIGENTFACTGLTNVSIGNNVKYIGDQAFSWCKITSITIPDGVTCIGDYAFCGCTGLKSITIPDSVTSIGGGAFKDCTGLTSVTIGNSVTSIGEEAFYGCTGLTSITIPDSVTSIGSGAFGACIGLTSITIPDSVTSIGDDAFYWCTGLTSITVSAGNTVYHSTDNCLIETESKKLILGCKNSIIPSEGSVTSIGDQAFAWCEITSITIPDSVMSIGDWAFSDCTGLTSITIPDSVTSIGDYAFYYCVNLTSVTISATVTDIGDRAFGYYHDNVMANQCKVKNFTIYGYAGTAAETYANENGFAFISHDNGHVFSEWVVTTEPTCTAEGEETRTCSVCGATETRPVEKKAHDLFHVEEASTCTVAGVSYDVCDSCGNTFNHVVLPLAPHTFSDWVTTKQATVFESGVRIRTCTGCGKVSETNPINKVSSIKLSKTSFTYNGKVQKPTVTVKDSKGTALKNGRDYTVKYSSGRKDVGTYSVTVTMKGIYSGSKKLYFSILPQGTSIKSLSASSAGFTAKWKKKTNQITGYQLQYSTSNSFKSVKTITIKKNSDTSRTVSNLKGRTKYYVRVRTYKKVGNKNYYSSWSSAKTVATKPVTGVEILSSATIYVGGSKTLSAKTYPTKVTVKWKSSNTSVAKVSSNGKVTAIKKGRATITAYFTYNGKTYKANCAVTVKSRNPKIK